MRHELALSIAAGALTALSATAQQASLVLERGDAALCLHNTTDWTLSKTLNGQSTVTGPANVSWTITATRGATSNDVLEVNGFLRVRNGGTAPATIGNIVINLQRQRLIGNQTRWVSASADVADATNNDTATSAKIVNSASQENAAWNGQWNSPATYATSGQQGTFSENAGSGPIEFTDASNNTIWSLVPQQTIPGNQAVDLLYSATFNNSVLQIPVGASVRAEIIVTFGNSGRRGGSGSSANNIDINGNGSIDPDEANVRSVPDRQTRTIPALEACNDSVTVTDTGLTTTGTATYSNYQDGGLGAPGVSVNATTPPWTVSATVDGSGSVCNAATLFSPGSSVQVIKGYDPVTQLPNDWYTFECCEGLDLSASACVSVNSSPGFTPGDYCSYTQGGYGAPGNGVPDQLILGYFASVWPSSPWLEVGIPGPLGFSMQFTSALGVRAYLPAGGPSSALTADLGNPTSSSSGTLGGQVLTLKINVAFSDASVTPSSQSVAYGDLYYCNASSSLNGLKIRQILAAMELALGGGSLPSGYSYGALTSLADQLNQAFDNCGVSSFATEHLSRTACP